MAHVSDPHCNDRQLVRREQEKLVPLLDGDFEGRSAADRRAGVILRLAALGEMTGGIAHDFSNVLAIIASGLALAERNLEQPERFIILSPGRAMESAKG